MSSNNPFGSRQTGRSEQALSWQWFAKYTGKLLLPEIRYLGVGPQLRPFVSVQSIFNAASWTDK